MRAAAAGEDGSVKHVAVENRLYPLRELLGELLLELGQSAAALNEFETALKAEEQLATLEKICLIPCEEFGDLQRAIAAYRGAAAP